MTRRKIPYGYMMRSGVIVINPKEAKTVRLIFELAASGRSGGEILPLIVTDDDDYFSCDTLKAVNKIHGILRKEYYCGSEDYPAITDRECFEQARKCIAERDRWQSQNRSKIPVYMACCGICGEPLYRCRNPKDRG